MGGIRPSQVTRRSVGRLAKDHASALITVPLRSAAMAWPAGHEPAPGTGSAHPV